MGENLYKYELAVVTHMRNNSAKVEEWIEYHLLAGVNHFYIYDNDSLDGLEKTLKAYVDAGLVTYIYFGGQKKIGAYNDAVNKFKYECRYMAFIDVEEYIYPKKNRSIVEVTDEILRGKVNVGGIELNRYTYSSGMQVGEVTGGVLDNYKRRGRKAFEVSNTIVNPRKVDYFYNTRYAVYFDGIQRINDYSGELEGEKVSEKAVVNSYKKEETKEDSKTLDTGRFILSSFYRSNIFDDGIVNYRDSRRESLNGTEIIEAYGNKVDDGKLLKVLSKTLLPSFDEEDAVEYFKTQENQLKYFRGISEYYVKAPDEFFEGKLETFLTSLNVALRLKSELDETAGKFFVDATLNAIVQTLCMEFTSADAYLLIREMPKILTLKTPTVETLKSICAGMIESMTEMLKRGSEEKKNQDIDEEEMTTWRKITELETLSKFLAIVNVVKE